MSDDFDPCLECTDDCDDCDDSLSTKVSWLDTSPVFPGPKLPLAECPTCSREVRCEGCSKDRYAAWHAEIPF